jgi:SAM-dependent methyltransferase
MPPTPDELHLDRARALSFGSAADQYDRFRPACPADLIDDLVARRPARAIDVGCGTGKVAVPLALRGIAVLGIEVDERMAEFARHYGIEVRVTAFESFAPGDAAFDLLTCGDAWHWIDPERGTAKAAEVLRPGGTIARFWTTSTLDEATAAAFAPIYESIAPEITQVWLPSAGPRRFHATRPDPIAQSPEFTPTDLRTYPWDRTLNTEQWLGLIATTSDHQRLPAKRLKSLLHELGAATEKLGGIIHTKNETYALVNRRVESG